MSTEKTSRLYILLIAMNAAKCLGAGFKLTRLGVVELVNEIERLSACIVELEEEIKKLKKEVPK